VVPRALVTSLAAAAIAIQALAAPRPASAWDFGDTLTVIWYPLPSLPALVRPGDTLTVWANAPSSASGWSAQLQYAALPVPLPAAGGGWVAGKGRWELRFLVPPGAPAAIYDLSLTSDATLPDTSRHAVRVFQAFRNSFYFAQISDTHLPTHALSSNGVIDPADTTGMADFDAVIADLNLIHPEFVLHTGDLVNEGELEEYLGMYEMGRAKDMLSRLEDPVFVTSGNHDQGGWSATAPPDGTARKNWWRHFGWPYLGAPPAGDPYHSEDFSFDYGLLHVVGLEAYINSGSYDHYLQSIWGAQSFTAEQMSWLAADLAAVPAGHAKLLCYHYDFGGTLPNGSPGASFTQIYPIALGVDGAIWGHNHGVAEGNRAARPFNLGLQAVIDGQRTFRIFRVSGNTITPGPMHHAGGGAGTPADSLASAWSGPNDGTARALAVTVVNRYGERWEHSRVVFHLADHDSEFTATGGSIAEVIRAGGVAHVFVDCVFNAGATTPVSVVPSRPIAKVTDASPPGLAFARPVPNPWRGTGTVALSFTLPAGQRVSLAVFDTQGRRTATLADGWLDAGEQTLLWDGREAGGTQAAAGVYLVRLRGEGFTRTQRLAITR
jgi:hypothetical protein